MKKINLLFSKIFSCWLMLFFIFPAIANADTVENAYKDWCSAIGNAKGNAEVVVKYYAPDAILLPTLSPKILVNHAGGLNDYFVKLTSHHDLKCTPEKLITRTYGGMAINSGLYRFSYLDHGKKVVIPARFTFVYKNENNHWMIVNHHSSKLP